MWKKVETNTTKHTCGGPIFGKKTAGCPRCDELIAGAKPTMGWGSAKKEQEKSLAQAIRNHNCFTSRCGVVCTAFQW